MGAAGGAAGLRTEAPFGAVKPALTSQPGWRGEARHLARQGRGPAHAQAAPLVPSPSPAASNTHTAPGPARRTVRLHSGRTARACPHTTARVSAGRLFHSSTAKCCEVVASVNVFAMRYAVTEVRAMMARVGCTASVVTMLAGAWACSSSGRDATAVRSVEIKRIASDGVASSTRYELTYKNTEQLDVVNKYVDDDLRETQEFSYIDAKISNLLILNLAAENQNGPYQFDYTDDRLVRRTRSLASGAIDLTELEFDGDRLRNVRTEIAFTDGDKFRKSIEYAYAQGGALERITSNASFTNSDGTVVPELGSSEQSELRFNGESISRSKRKVEGDKEGEIIWDFLYGPENAIDEIRLSNGVSFSFSYNVSGLIEKIENANAATSVSIKIAYEDHEVEGLHFTIPTVYGTFFDLRGTGYSTEPVLTLDLR